MFDYLLSAHSNTFCMDQCLTPPITVNLPGVHARVIGASLRRGEGQDVTQICSASAEEHQGLCLPATILAKERGNGVPPRSPENIESKVRLCKQFQLRPIAICIT